jgi:hypothetical protein
MYFVGSNEFMSDKSLLFALLLMGFFSCAENKEEKMPEVSTPILVDTDTAQQNVVDAEPTNETKVLEVMEENKKPIVNEVKIKSNGWGKKDAFDFLAQCEKNAKKKMDDQKAVVYCECVLANMKLKYPNAADAEKIEVSDMLKLAKDCMDSN